MKKPLQCDGCGEFTEVDWRGDWPRLTSVYDAGWKMTIGPGRELWFCEQCHPLITGLDWYTPEDEEDDRRFLEECEDM